MGESLEQTSTAVSKGTPGKVKIAPPIQPAKKLGRLTNLATTATLTLIYISGCTLPESSSVPCQCASQTVTRINSKTTFNGLDHWEEYFPMIARVEDLSIFGAPPAPKSANRNPRRISYTHDTSCDRLNSSERRGGAGC